MLDVIAGRARRSILICNVLSVGATRHERPRGRVVSGVGIAAVGTPALVRRHQNQPVWGALESNKASLRLAEKLGFCAPAGTLWLAE